MHLIDNFPIHPYYLFDDEEMPELTAGIKANGLLNPVIVHSKADRRYELISDTEEKGLMKFKKSIKYRLLLLI